MLGHQNRHTLSLKCIEAYSAIKFLNRRYILTGTVIKAYDYRQKVSEKNCTLLFYAPTGDP